MTWNTFEDQQPPTGQRIVALYSDGSGAVLFLTHDGGAIDADGDEWPGRIDEFSHWALLPEGIELFFEMLEPR